MAKFRKKPVVIDAVQWTGSNPDELIGFMLTGASIRRTNYQSAQGGIVVGGCLLIETLEGEMRADPFDWIIKGVKGEFYPCKPDIFATSYEAVE